MRRSGPELTGAGQMGAGLRGPNFFIVGAPRCGTSALADFLGQHPEIGMCAWKETHHFDPSYWRAFGEFSGTVQPSRDEYLAGFTTVQDRRRLGEASVWYLYSVSAVDSIHRYDPSAKVIVMVRNPVTMLPSLHAMLVLVGVEPQSDFKKAFDLDGLRERTGPPAGFPIPSYRSAVKYSAGIERYVSRFGREQVHVMVSEQFRARLRESYGAVCRFLDVDDGFTPRTAEVNRTRTPRSRLVHRALRRWNRDSRSPLVARAARGVAGLNLRHAELAQPSDELLSRIRLIARTEATELRRLGVDVESWGEQLEGDAEAQGDSG